MSGSPAARFVRVYRSSRKQDMYLYVDARQHLEAVPEELLARFGKPVEALSLTLLIALGIGAAVMARPRPQPKPVRVRARRR